jgi:heme exporter protein B
MAGFWPQFRAILRHGFNVEASNRERLISPLLFSTTILLLFSFAVGEVDKALKVKMYLAQTYLTGFFALQIAYGRIFDPYNQDRVFDLMRCYPVDYSAWFLGKYVLVLATSCLILFPTMLISAFLNHDPNQVLLSKEIFLFSLLCLGGLTAIGVLLSALTLKATARQIVFPLLYFPLTAPVLLAAVQGSLMLYDQENSDSVREWALLLVGFDVIYFTLGMLLYSLLVDDS